MDVHAAEPTVKGPPEWFTGAVFIDALAPISGASFGSVHFTPGARSAWHAHSVGQTLYVTEGAGLVQARGAEVVRIRPGDVVSTPAAEWHWHGAAPDHFMTHFSITEGSTEWGDHVTDSEYGTA
jgi:quercetin dioxygenase-like cupin family protein